MNSNSLADQMTFANNRVRDNSRRLLFASRHDFPPYSRGGGELCALELLSQLAGQYKVHVDVLCIGANHCSSESYLHCGLNVMRVPDSIFTQALDIATGSGELAGVITYLEGTSTVALHCEASGIPVGLLIVDRGGVFDGLSSFTQKPRIVVAISEYLSKLSRDHFDVVTEVYPPSVRPPRKSSVISSDRRFSLRTVGMVNPNRLKGGDLFARLVAAFPDLRFLAVRGWSYPEIAPEVLLIGKNITLMEWCDDVDLFYDKITILVVPSLCPEGFGRVAREAILRGIPILASSRGALKESSCNAGILLDPTDLVSWQTAVVRLTSDFGLFGRLAADAILAGTIQQKTDTAVAEKTVKAVASAFGLA